MALLMHPLFNHFNISRGADIGIPVAHQTHHYVAPTSTSTSPFTTPSKPKRLAEDDAEGMRSAKRTMAPERTVNLFLRTIFGMGLPSTLCIPISSRSTIEDMAWTIQERIYYNIPPQNIRLATSTGRILCNLNGQPIQNKDTVDTLLYTTSDTMLTLRLTVPTFGGKGGFGSQLRAAGGRMSSRKKKNQGEQNGSSRNLDGRRLRTVTEAKALAEYLAIKPDMDKKEKEERRKRWQEIVDATERKTEEIKSGKGKSRLDGKWVEAKEEATEKTREAVLAAMAAGDIKDAVLRESDESMSGSDDEGQSESENEVPAQKNVAFAASAGVKPSAPASKTFFGWDEDEDMSESDEEEQQPIEKGKATAIEA